MKDFLAIDIGASSGRHILGRMEAGKLVLEEIYRFPNAPKRVNGHLVWDVDSLFEEILAGMKKAGEMGRAPESVGIDTWGVDYCLLDKNYGRIGEAFCYRDSRTEEVIPEVHARIPFASLYEKTGIQFASFNTIYQLYSDKVSGKLNKAEHMLMLPDYFHFLLTGKLSREYTNAATTGLVSAIPRTWCGEITSALGFPDKLFPQTSPSGTVLGELKKDIQSIVGYNAKVVLPATHDTASAVVASLAEEGTPYISSGTWSLLGIVSKAPRTDEKSLLFNYSNEGHIGHKVRFQKNIMGLWLIQQIRREAAEHLSFAQLTALAKDNPTDCRIDVNDARFLAPANMLREVQSAAGKNLSLGEAAYCVLASLACGYRDAVLQLQSVTGEKYTDLNVMGGGSQNRLLNELTARETGLKITVGPVEATAIGNLLVQMSSAGELDIKSSKQLVKKSFETEEII